jgi:hypothetical protein
MHVVGSAKGHPEMIWATFEHFGNSPNAIFRYNATSGANPSTVGSTPPTCAGTWLFCANGSTGPFNVMKAKYVSPNIEGWDAVNRVAGNTPIVPSDIVRWKPFGAALDTKPNPLIPDYATSNTQIIAIDNSILQNFAALPVPPGGPDVRTNYFMLGATWTEGGAAPSGSFATGIDVGTSQLANTTMETFQQTTTAFNAFSSNCFSCHATNQLNVSHVACDPAHFPGCSNGIQPLFP